MINKKAFTLIEMAIVLTILAIAVGSVIKLLNVSYQKDRMIENKQDIHKIKQALIGYAALNNKLPSADMVSDPNGSNGKGEGQIGLGDLPYLDLHLSVKDQYGMNYMYDVNGSLLSTTSNTEMCTQLESIANSQTGLPRVENYNTPVTDTYSVAAVIVSKGNDKVLTGKNIYSGTNDRVYEMNSNTYHEITNNDFVLEINAMELYSRLCNSSDTDSSYASCNEAYNDGKTTDGIYSIDPDGIGGNDSIAAYCDMTTDGGGWTLVLNYLHEGGTNPALNVMNDTLPLPGSNTLGYDESNSTTTWGHASNSMMNSLTFTEVRFYGITSGHGRIMHFKTSESSVINYFKTGSGQITDNSDFETAYTTLSGNSANLPTGSNGFYSNEGDSAMTSFPFYVGGTYHWGIRGGGSRWEIDDYPNGPANNTLHRIWVK